MFVKTTSIRVRYAETDQMGVVYYGNYAQFFEVGRVEALRELGMTYRKMEEEGFMLPVLKMEIKYVGSAKYDDLLEIKTIIKELPKTRFRFEHEISIEGKLITLGVVELVFVDAKTRRPCSAPDKFLEKLAAHL